MKKLILSIGVIALTFGSIMSVNASGNYSIRNVDCPNGGSVYRCDYGGSESCNVSGQKFCDEIIP
jgi:hypothetical protein